MARSGLRKQTPVSPAKAIPAPVSTRRKSARLPGSSKIQDPQLNPVHEEEDTTTISNKQISYDATEIEEEELADEEDVYDESDDYSEWDDEDIVSLDKDIIIDNLNAINVDVDDIFRLISSGPASQVFSDVQNPLSGIAKRFEHFSQRLINNLEPCGTEVLLQSSRLSRFVSDGHLNNDVENLFIRANLALVLVKLLQARWDDQDEALDNLLSYLAEIKTFPAPFLQHDAQSRPASAKFTKDFRLLTIEVGLSILTQWFVWNAGKKSNQDHVDPDALAIAVFYQDDHDRAREIFLGPSTQKTRDTVSKAVTKRVTEIQEFYTHGEGNSVRLDDLREKFPVEEMIGNVIVWATARKEQLDLSIEKQGGVERIRDSLWNSQRMTSSDRLKQKRKKRKSRGGQALEDGAAFLRNVDEYLDATAPEPTETQDQEPQPESPTVPQHFNEIEETPPPEETLQPEETPQPDEVVAQPSPRPQSAQDLVEDYTMDVMNDDGQSIPEAPPSAQPEPLRDITQDVIDGEDNIRAAANKENLPYQKPRPRLTDRQANATRETFDSPEPSAPTARDSGKQVQNPAESDEEEEFITNPRPSKRARIAKDKPSRPPPRAPESSFFLPELEDLVSRRGPRQRSPSPPRHTRPPSSPIHPALPSPTPPHRTRPSSSLPVPTRTRSPSTNEAEDDGPGPSTYEGYQRAKDNIKPNLQMSIALLPPSTNPSTNLQAAYPSHQTLHNRVQVRRPWTPGEIERLLILIRDYQTQWSKMMKIDAQMIPPMLQNRTQVQLKDKARNMKLDYLKAEMRLPEGFDGVTISKAHKDVLRRIQITLPDEFNGDE